MLAGMGHLVYSAIASLDGYIADADGDFSWAQPSAQVHAFVNDLEQSVGTHLFGRRTYEVMTVWDDLPDLERQSPEMRDYAAVWQGIDKVVYSSTLPSVTTLRTSLERSFDADTVRALVARSDKDVSVGGPTLAAHAFAARLVDAVHIFLLPVVVGGGLSCWPVGQRAGLELADHRRFDDGTVYLHYRICPDR